VSSVTWATGRCSSGVRAPADYGNDRVHVLTPTLDFHSFVGVGRLLGPIGVCANADVVVVSEVAADRISVFNRHGGALVRRFGSHGRGPGELMSPRGLCFMSGDRHVAVTYVCKDRVSVFSIDGEFIRHVGVGELIELFEVVCSAFDELVVADTRNHRVVVFSDDGELLMSFGDGCISGVVVHGSTVLAQDFQSQRCVVWS
jgi:DNA-binding beta-propeller fold protein YncE